MAGLVSFNFGPLKKAVDSAIDSKMRQMADIGVAEARRLVPVRTGQLRDSIQAVYRQSDKTVQLYADKFYSVFVEWGTSKQAAQPFLRPAMNAMAKVWGSGGINLELATPMTPTKYAAGYQAKIGSHIKVGGGFLKRGRQAAVKIGSHTRRGH